MNCCGVVLILLCWKRNTQWWQTLWRFQTKNFYLSLYSDIFVTTFIYTGTSEIDQLYKIASILGTPGRNDWPDGYGLAGNMHFKFPTFKSTHLAQVSIIFNKLLSCANIYWSVFRVCPLLVKLVIIRIPNLLKLLLVALWVWTYVV